MAMALTLLLPPSSSAIFLNRKFVSKAPFLPRRPYGFMKVVAKIHLEEPKILGVIGTAAIVGGLIANPVGLVSVHFENNWVWTATKSRGSFRCIGRHQFSGGIWIDRMVCVY